MREHLRFRWCNVRLNDGKHVFVCSEEGKNTQVFQVFMDFFQLQNITKLVFGTVKQILVSSCIIDMKIVIKIFFSTV